MPARSILPVPKDRHPTEAPVVEAIQKETREENLYVPVGVSQSDTPTGTYIFSLFSSFWTTPTPIVCLILTLCLAFSLAACQAEPTTAPVQSETTILEAVLVPTATLPPTASPTPPYPAGVLWIDVASDLGAISPFTLGGNHGPWSDFSLDAFEKTIELGITFIRWPGGAWGDQNDMRQMMIDTYIAQARKIGAEPSIAVRLPGSSPEKAAETVRYVNLIKAYGVKYWSIGNEPNLFDNDPNLNIGVTWTPEYYAKTWREFALAMEAVDPSILFYGPDISQFTGDSTQYANEGDARDYLLEFLKVNGDLVDVVTIHRYPFPKCSTCGNPTWEQLRADTAEWDNIFPDLRRVIQETTGKDLPVGMMEYNSYYTNAVGSETSPDSFYSGLWLADIYGRMVRQRPEMLAIWQLKNNNGGWGLLTSFDVRPSYYAFTMWKKFGDHLLDANSDTQYVSIFAARTEAGAVTVMLTNLSGQEVREPLQFDQGDGIKLSEAYLFDRTHNAEAIEPPAFTNGGEIVLPAESVTLFILR